MLRVNLPTTRFSLSLADVDVSSMKLWFVESYFHLEIEWRLELVFISLF